MIRKRRFEPMVAIVLAMPLIGVGFLPTTTVANATTTPFCGPMDIAIALDNTGSMGGAIDNVVDELPDLIDQAEEASGGDLRLGYITFKDDVTVHHALTADLAPVEDSIAATTASGGVGLPEASDIAKDTAVNNKDDFNEPWRGTAVKILILITDAPPGGLDDNTDPEDVARMHDVAEDAAASEIKVSDVFVPTAGDYAGQAAILEDDATTSGGVFITTNPDGTGTADAIRAIIEACGERPPDNSPPNCETATLSEAVLWPPNHKLKEVSISGVTDPDDNLVGISITGITQDEPTNGLGDGDKSPDAQIVDRDTVKVRAERSGTDDGRVYHISFEASDDEGATCSGILVLPVVPHDQGFGNTPIDSRPPEFDSTVP